MGAWTMVRDFIEDMMADIGIKQQRLIYAGRAAAASPATGSLSRHNAEQQGLVAAALGLDAADKAAAAEYLLRCQITVLAYAAQSLGPTPMPSTPFQAYL